MQSICGKRVSIFIMIDFLLFLSREIDIDEVVANVSLTLVPNQDRIRQGEPTAFLISMGAGSHVNFFLQFGDGSEKNFTHPSIFGSEYAVYEKHLYTSTGCYNPVLLVYNQVSTYLLMLLL